MTVEVVKATRLKFVDEVHWSKRMGRLAAPAELLLIRSTTVSPEFTVKLAAKVMLKV